MTTDLTRFNPQINPVSKTNANLDELVATYAKPKDCYVLIVFDATGSMERHWNHTATMIDEMSTRMVSVGANVRLKLCAYRDHCDKERIIECSPWSNDPVELGHFIKGIVCDGGGDFPEAVDEGLKVAVKEEQVARVILIGDAPPHEEQDCSPEATELGRIKRPVYPIVIGHHPATHESFGMIARLSGGKMINLDNLEELFELITILAADAAGPGALRRYQENYHLSPSGEKLLLELRR